MVPGRRTDMNTQVDTEVSERRVAKHSLLNKQGEAVEDFEEATGIRYQDIASGVTFDYQLKGDSDALRMLALFGARTLATNEASAARQKDGDQIEAIKARFALIDSGTWVDRTREGGPRLDHAKLATAVVNVFTNAGKAPADPAAAIEKLLKNWAEDPKKASIAHSVPGVRDEYAKLTGKTTRTVDDLMAQIA